ncbi:hypothetical protein [Mycobacterium branderi]|uniref:Transcriptional regulator n=1 Tax=Mycobacterium branderi TaxID=43348 RepID=A0A7I7W4D0_9MYCO|nr:hypothetical protein [Mycobacterium branderi]MCV7235687.1 hypothetical protein [Mycobacterium branderi]ORA37877.1 hypothetical protein BST20_12150 [Mycobacterium branderi]BBZ12434.1 hypothetical protein MBRA_26290 [Mycobacterium branderi]
MTTIKRSTLQHDLDNLLAELDAGWESASVIYGRGGCVMACMVRMLRRQGADDLQARKDAMVTALGFQSSDGPAYEAMFRWNDLQADPDAVKRRIKDALNTL